MADLQQLAGAEPRPADFQYRGHEVNIEYDRSLITAEWIDKAMMSPGLEPVADALVDVLLSWDVMDRGEPLPIEKDRLYKLPIGFLRSMTKAISTDAMSAGEEEGKASGATSPLEGSLVESPGGQN